MNNMRTYLHLVSVFILLSMVECSTPTHAQLSTSRIFADHMVLQRNQKVAVWGWGTPDAEISVNFNGQQLHTTVATDSSWKVMLKPMKEGGPYVMQITSGSAQLEYKDVMLGEVWICSGQSNMQFYLNQATGFKQEQAQATNLPVRQFQVPQKMSLQPEKDIASGEWVKADSSTVGYFTAVGYYFAKQLAQQLHVTVGIVHSSWGSSQAECWISKGAMLGNAALKEVASQQPDNWDEIKKHIDGQIKTYAYNNKPVALFKIDQLAAQPSAFFDTWKTGSVGAWQWQGGWTAYRGTGFMQRKVSVSAAQSQMPSVLQLGQTDASIDLYINGKSIYQGSLPKGQPITLPAGTWHAGDNNLVMELLTNQKDPWWFGFGINGDAKDTYIKFADNTLPLADNNWHLMANLAKPYHIEPMPNNTVYTLYNGMINPLKSLTVAGVAWYQGEANTSRAYQYRTTLPLLIKDWRSKFKGKIPFFFVQLPSYGPTQNSNQGSPWAELREAQTMALQLPNTGMAVTFDTGDPYNLHPPQNKATIGTRLAYAALNKVYHLSVFGISPVYKSASFSGGDAWVSFKGADDGLTIQNNASALKGFEIAGSDHHFYPAQAEIVDHKVRIWSSQVKRPVAVRYAWSDSPIGANLFSKSGLPVSPFRSDNFREITANGKLKL